MNISLLHLITNFILLNIKNPVDKINYQLGLIFKDLMFYITISMVVFILVLASVLLLYFPEETAYSANLSTAAEGL